MKEFMLKVGDILLKQSHSTYFWTLFVLFTLIRIALDSLGQYSVLIDVVLAFIFTTVRYFDFKGKS